MPLSTADISFVCDLVTKSSGIMLSDRQGYLVESRLAGVAEARGYANAQQIVGKLRSGDIKLHEQVVEAMTINETSFFRDAAPFEALQTVIIPQLIEARRSTKRLSIWCAASSSGQEPYSVAIVLREYFPDLVNWNVSITATDISEAMLDRTREGNYTQFEVNRGLPARMLVKHFERKGEFWQAKESLRKIIQCRHLNLTDNWGYMPKFDLVLIRNVLVYFDRQRKEDILRRIRKQVTDDAYVFLGGGETMINLPVDFERHTIAKAVCFRPKPS